MTIGANSFSELRLLTVLGSALGTPSHRLPDPESKATKTLHFKASITAWVSRARSNRDWTPNQKKDRGLLPAWRKSTLLKFSLLAVSPARTTSMLTAAPSGSDTAHRAQPARL
jgi:hypothetical protein